MIYVSSSCVKHEKIVDSVRELARSGFINIELSGGTKYYEGYEEDLLELKEKYNLNYLMHNYFPPPEEDFILNLASLNDEIYHKTIDHYEKAISLSKKLCSKKFSFHAGYFIDIIPAEIGRKISFSPLFDKKKAIERFCEGYNFLKNKAEDIELYIENNIFSYTNFKTFKGQCPFMLTDYRGYEELKSYIDFKLLLDVGHLKVSANSLELDFDMELDKMISISDYIHLSDNDGLNDSNSEIKKDGNVYNILGKINLVGKIITIEVYRDIKRIKKTFDFIKGLIQC